jgi:hypothetical protein
MTDVKVGQKWKERDSRFSRAVVVVALDGERQKVCISNFDPMTGKLLGRKTWASRERFNGKHGGYELLGDSE